MKLILQTITGIKYAIMVEPTMKVREVKRKIFDTMEIKNKVTLLYGQEPMVDGFTLESLMIPDESTIQMVIEPEKKIKITVQTFKKGQIPLEVHDTDTLNEVYDGLANSGIGPSTMQQEFFFNGTELTDYSMPLYMMGITDGDIIDQKCDGKMKIKLENANNLNRSFRYLPVRGSDTVGKFTRFVSMTLEQNANSIVLFHETEDKNGQKLFDELDIDEETLYMCGIMPNDTIMFINYNSLQKHYSLQIQYTDSEGKEWEKQLIWLDGGHHRRESGRSLMLKIQHQFNIPYHLQRLRFKQNLVEVNANERYSQEQLSNGNLILEKKLVANA